jgi:hypothetical protein
MTEIGNPFDGEAARLMQQQSFTEQQSRDFVVWRYLKIGDTRALAHWLMADYQPGAGVAVLLSYMLQPERHDANDTKKTNEIDAGMVPYGLTSFPRAGQKGRRPDPTAAERNQAIKGLYDEHMLVIGPGGHESAIATLKELLGPDINESAIKEALKARSPKSRP